MSVTIFDFCQGDLQTIMKMNLKCGTLEEMMRLQIFLLMNLNWKTFYLIQKEMLVFSFSITYVCV